MGLANLVQALIRDFPMGTLIECYDHRSELSRKFLRRDRLFIISKVGRNLLLLMNHGDRSFQISRFARNDIRSEFP